MKLRVCAFERCGKTLEPKRTDMRFCSGSCRARASRSRALGETQALLERMNQVRHTSEEDGIGEDASQKPPRPRGGQWEARVGALEQSLEQLQRQFSEYSKRQTARLEERLRRFEGQSEQLRQELRAVREAQGHGTAKERKAVDRRLRDLEAVAAEQADQVAGLVEDVGEMATVLGTMTEWLAGE